jgi:hypothetical protein
VVAVSGSVRLLIGCHDLVVGEVKRIWLIVGAAVSL